MYIFCKQHHDVCDKSAAQIVCRVSFNKVAENANSKIEIKIKVKSTPYMQICKVIDASLMCNPSKNTVGET